MKRLSTLALLAIIFSCSTNNTSVEWNDLNKNGRMDVYENPDADIDKRVENLMSQMTVEEKVAQTLMPKGWYAYKRIGDQVELSDTVKCFITENGLGGMYGVLRADPWTKITIKTGLNFDLSRRVTNLLQKYAREHTRLGIPLLFLDDCPHGLMAIGGTVYPTAIGQASTWNPELIEKMGKAIAKEARRQGSHLGDGPILDTSRDPRWSRVEETFGEDPYLIGVMGKSLLKGLNDNTNGEMLMSTLKHYVAYGVPEGGHNSGTALVSDFELNEVFLAPFKKCIGAGAQSVMTSYNEVNGFPVTMHKELLIDKLVKEWNFKGFVVSDLNAIAGIKNHGIVETEKEAARLALLGGTDMDLGAQSYPALTEVVKKSKECQKRLNDAVAKILRIKFEMHLFENPFVTTDKPVLSAEERNSHLELAERIAEESITLLENHDDILPLDSLKVHNIALIGPNADNAYNLLGDYTAPQEDGTVTTILDGMKNISPQNIKINYAKGCSIRGESKKGFQEALNIARQADVVIMAMGGSSARDFSTKYVDTGAAKITKKAQSDMECGEGSDRATLDFLGVQNELIKEVAELGKPIILVLVKGRPLILEPARQYASAILDAWYPGMRGGNAVAKAIWGKINPSGHLPISVTKCVGALPVYYNTKRHANRNAYTDYYNFVSYPFGYGLSYSDFTYTDMQVIIDDEQNHQVTVKAKIKNVSDRDGSTVPQLYIQDCFSSHTTPVLSLKAFKKILVPARSEMEICFHLDNETFEIYKKNGEWEVEPGKFKIMLGSSSSDIKCTEVISFTS